MSTFFQEGPSAERGRAGGRVAISDYRARAVLVDMEEGVVNAVRRGPLGCLFDDSQYISASYGAGNNWCVRVAGLRLCGRRRGPTPDPALAPASQGLRLRRVRPRVSGAHH